MAAHQQCQAVTAEHLLKLVPAFWPDLLNISPFALLHECCCLDNSLLSIQVQLQTTQLA